ncbi:MAG: glutathione S-transferase N-terminal domain-containing protein [Spongiibacteraceae bacterium]|jgi:GST-like protein|nr:glutathione S-transferase N-terminal domain-containing protein [Spongiibacteraceae bacterium]
MLDLYFAPTPNGWKITIMLEECGLPYRVKLVNLASGEQFEPAFLAMNPNARMPVLVDPDAEGGPLTVFESGAILMYLAQKTGRFLPADTRGFYRVTQWLFWQMANLGPAGGQASHFVNYAGEGHAYARQRYLDEYDRLLGVMNFQLADSEYLAGDYSIADMAAYPWLLPYRRYGFSLDGFPHLRRWYDALKSRPALRRGVDVGKAWRRQGEMDAATRETLFNQTSARYQGGK